MKPWYLHSANDFMEPSARAGAARAQAAAETPSRSCQGQRPWKDCRTLVEGWLPSKAYPFCLSPVPARCFDLSDSSANHREQVLVKAHALSPCQDAWEVYLELRSQATRLNGNF